MITSTAVSLRSSFLLSLCLILGSSAAVAQCTLKTADPSITICQPSANASVSSPVTITAGSTDSAGVIAMAIYVDNVLVKKVSGNQISATASFAEGTHYLVAQLWDNAGRIIKQPEYFNVTASSAPPVASLTANPTSITAGQNATLTWSTSNATSVTIDNGIGAVPASGSTVVTPNATTTYTLTATGPDGTATAQATVSVGSSGGGTCSPAGAAPSVTICSPTNGSTVASPVHVVAVPNSNNGVIAMAVYFDNTLVYKTHSSSVDTLINAATGRHFVVVQFWNNSGNVSAKASEYITVGSNTSQPTATLTANPPSITSGGTSTLSWSTTNASSVSIDNGIGSVGVSGTMNVSPAQTTTYTLTATGSGGSTTATATVTVGTSGGSGGTCSQASPAPSVTICSPASGSTVNSPVHVVAVPNSNNGVIHMDVYFDNQVVYRTNGDTVDAQIDAAPGRHYVVVQFWDNSGNVPAKASEYITVSSTSGSGSGVDVTTFHNDQARTGANTHETILTPANVNPTHFGKIVGYGVDGQVYAQPLIVSNLNIGGGTNNVLYVATEHDSVYAFNADYKTGAPYWSESLLAPGQSPASSSDYTGIAPEIGITGTPVIDRANNTLYVVSMVYVSGFGNEFWLHALDLTNGAEKFGGPVRINPTVNGTGAGNVNGIISIEGGCYQRAGLALASGNVYVSFGHCSHGWVVAYNESTLALSGVYNTSPNGKGAAIWMSGGAPALDSSNNLYFETGVDADSTVSSGYSDSFLKLSPSLSLLDYFQVSNNAYLTANDADLGSGAPVVLPDNSSAYPHEVIGAGKDGRIFLVNRDNMGGFDPNANHVIQVVQSGVQQFDNFFDQPAYWNGYIYYHAEGDVLRQFKWSNGLLSTSPIYTGSTTFGVHGATPSVSADGNSNGIVWELQVDAQPTGNAILHAYDATNVSHELYNSTMNSGDWAGPAVKFTVPTIANGKVYVPAGNQVDIYGLK